MASNENHVPANEAVSEAFRACRGVFAAITVFSFFVNLFILTVPLYMFAVFDKVLSSYSVATLIMLFVMALFALAVQGMIDVCRSYVLVSVGNYLEGRLSSRLLHAALAKSLKRGERRSISILMSFESVKQFLTNQSIFNLLDAPWIPLFIGVLFLMNPAVGMVAIVGAVVLGALALINDRITHASLRRGNVLRSKSTKLASAAARNADVVEAMGMTPQIIRAWNADNEAAAVYQAKASKNAAIILALSKWARMVVQISIMTTAAYMMIQPGSTLSPGIIMASVILVARALMPLEAMTGSYRQMIDAREAYKEIKETLADMEERPRLSVLPPEPTGHISVENVTFTIDGVDRPILSNVSFEVRPGEVIGVIGPSGAGKTTLAMLLVGLEHATSGTVRMDGTDVYSWPSEHLGQYLGYLPQSVELFGGSIRDNICRMDPDATAESIIDAAQMAGLHEIIQRMPREYDTEVGFGGMLLSGGQRQRVGLARALYNNPLFVVLDEPNSNLDSEGEEALRKTLHTLKERGASVILIAHRINILQHVDKVLVMRDGIVQKFAARDDVIKPIPAQPAPKVVREEEKPAIAGQAKT